MKCSCPRPSCTSLVALRPQQQCPHRKAAAAWLHVTAYQLPKPMVRKTRVHSDPREGRALVNFLHHCDKTPDRSNLGRKVSVGSQAEMVQSFLAGKACQSSWWPEHVTDHITAGSVKQRVLSQELEPGLKVHPLPPTFYQPNPILQRFYSLQKEDHPLETKCTNTSLKDISDPNSIRELNHPSVRQERCGHDPEGPIGKGYD